MKIVRIPRSIRKTGIALFLPVFFLSSCALWTGQGEYHEPLELRLMPERGEYAPGQALIVNVILKNKGSKNTLAAPLNAETVQFIWGQDGGPSALVRKPVKSPKETVGPPVLLSPGEAVDRKFLFVDLTPDTGEFTLQAICQSPNPDDGAGLTIISLPVRYRAAGARMFQRGSNGLISQLDAVRIARSRYGANAAVVQIALIVNEAGLYEWAVRLNLDPSGETLEERTCLVNPYTGSIRAEAQAQI